MSDAPVVDTAQGAGIASLDEAAMANDPAAPAENGCAQTEASTAEHADDASDGATVPIVTTPSDDGCIESNLGELYEKIALLGTGHFGKVFLVGNKKKPDVPFCALKVRIRTCIIIIRRHRRYRHDGR